MSIQEKQMSNFAPTPRFLSSRLAAMIEREAGRTLLREHYFCEGGLDTEEALDHYAGATSVACYRDAFDAIDGEHGLPTVYVLCRVIAHGTRHYEEGWDQLVECVEPSEMLPAVLALAEDATIEDAIRAVADDLCLEACIDQRNDALGAGGLPITDFKLGVE